MFRLVFSLTIVFTAMVANAQQIKPDVGQTLRSYRNLDVEVEHMRKLEEAFTLEDGPLSVTINSGYLIPVFSGRYADEWERKGRDTLLTPEEIEQGVAVPTRQERGTKQFVGFVWTKGTGALSARFGARGEALIFANELVLKGGHEKDTLMPIVEENAPYTTGVFEGLVLGIDPKYEAIFMGPDAEPDETAFDVIEVFASRGDANKAASRAKTLFTQRLKWMKNTGVDPSVGIPMDRVLEEKRGASASGQHTVMSFHSDTQTGLGDWFRFVRDDSGEHDFRRASTLSVVGLNQNQKPDAFRIAGEVFPSHRADDPLAAPMPPVRAEMTFAESQIKAGVTRSGGEIQVAIQSKVTIEAIGGPIHALTFKIPRVETVPNSWKLRSIKNADGESVLGRNPLITKAKERSEERQRDQTDDFNPDDGSESAQPAPNPLQVLEERASTLNLILPRTLNKGESITLNIRYEDTWPYLNWADCGAASRSAGQSSGLQDYIPHLAVAPPGYPTRFRTRVGVPKDSPLEVSLAGQTTRQGTDGTWDWVEAAETQKTAMWAMVAIGKWRSVYDPPYKNLPAVRVHLLNPAPSVLKSFAPEVRRVALYYQRWLPNWPFDELEVFEAPMQCNGYTWIAPHGMVSVQKTLVAGSARVGERGAAQFLKHRPHLESGLFAHELAHQYWGHVARPANTEDFWIAETFAESYACMYVAAGFKPRDCEVRQKQNRRLWEREYRNKTHIRASLTDAYRSLYQPEIVYQYGPYVMNEMLRRRLSKEAYFGALDRIVSTANGDFVTTEQLQAALEQSSKKDLQDFFDFWVHLGMVPKLRLDWEAHEDGTVSGELRSDIPFGIFDVPVVIVDGSTTVKTVWVQVKHGTGILPKTSVNGSAKVMLDPTYMVLAGSRRAVKRTP